jgi:hypothetical protein
MWTWDVEQQPLSANKDESRKKEKTYKSLKCEGKTEWIIRLDVFKLVCLEALLSQKNKSSIIIDTGRRVICDFDRYVLSNLHAGQGSQTLTNRQIESPVLRNETIKHRID